MRLYTLNNTGAVADPESGQVFKTDRDGAVDVPDALGAHLLATHFNGEKVWEDGGERSVRLHTEDETRRRDPMTMLGELQKITEALTGKGDDASASDFADAAKAAQDEADRLKKQADEAAAAEAKDAKAKQAEEAKAAKEKAAAEAKEAKAKQAEEAKTAKAKAAEDAKAAKAQKDAAQEDLL